MEGRRRRKEDDDRDPTLREVEILWDNGNSFSLEEIQKWSMHSGIPNVDLRRDQGCNMKCSPVVTFLAILRAHQEVGD